MASHRARDVVVHGRVQGVFFRASCRDEAVARGVAGWVSNEPDGSVRAHLEGPDREVDAVVEWLHHGPRNASVERVDVSEAAPEGLTGFEVR